MDKEHVKGEADKAKGNIKEAAGKATDNDRLKAEGQIDQAKGKAEKAVGDAKDAARETTDKR